MKIIENNETVIQQYLEIQLLELDNENAKFITIEELNSLLELSILEQ